MNIRNVPVIICLVVMGISCSKVKEEEPVAGKPLPYEQKKLPAIERLMDSLTDINIYRTIYLKSGAQHYIDSVRNAAGKLDVPFTLFMPRDAAWQNAGYDLARAQSISASECDALILYLLIQGRVLADSVAPAEGGITLYPVISPDMFSFEDEYGYMREAKHYYNLNIVFGDHSYYMNGNEAGTNTGIIAASDGAVYLLDSLVKIPTRSVYEILAADTSYSFYLAALEKSNSLYTDYKVGISPGDRNEELFYATADPFRNYLSSLKKFIPNGYGGPANWFTFSMIVLAPDNNAFRKAGMPTIEAVELFIEQSYITTDAYRDIDHAIPRYTNIDSALVYSYIAGTQATSGYGVGFAFEQKLSHISSALLYTPGIKWNKRLREEGIIASTKLSFDDWATFNENTWEFAPNITTGTIKWLFAEENGLISVRRGDMPDGPVAHFVPGHSDVTALNGVIHRIDNLLLSHP